MEPSYERADARVRAIDGTSAEHLSLFVTWLSSQQYSAGYACIVARHALAFGRWCEEHEVEVAALADVHVERFQRSRARRRSRRCETRRQERQALTLLLLFLREQGICAAEASSITDVDRVAAERIAAGQRPTASIGKRPKHTCLMTSQVAYPWGVTKRRGHDEPERTNQSGWRGRNRPSTLPRCCVAS